MVNEKELATTLARESEYSVAEWKRIIEALEQVIVDAIVSGEKVKLAKFGIHTPWPSKDSLTNY